MEENLEQGGSDRQRRGGFQRANFGNWTMTVQEAAVFFKTSGVARSERTIKRYCKDDTLVCRKFSFDTSQRWMVDPDSVNITVSELKEIQERKQEIQAQRPKNDTTEHVMSGQGEAEQGAEELPQLEERIKTLEVENDGLRINDAGSKQVIQMMKQERKELILSLEEKSHQIGALETQLQLSAPAEDPADEKVIHTTHAEEDNRPVVE